MLLSIVPVNAWAYYLEKAEARIMSVQCWIYWLRRYFRHLLRSMYVFLVEIYSAELIPYLATRHRIISKIPNYHGSVECFSILHLGCGTGYFADRLRHERSFALYTGIDQYAAFIRRARRKLRIKHPNYLFFRSNRYSKLAVAKGSQDVVLCSENPLRYARELCRILKDNGYVLATIPIRGSNLGPIIKEHLREPAHNVIEEISRQSQLIPIRLLYAFDLYFKITARYTARSLNRDEIIELYGVYNGISVNACQNTLVKITREQLWDTFCKECLPVLATLAA